jgi:hypothetical protein
LLVKGQKFLDVGPYLIIRLDNRVIGKTQITEENWLPLVFTPKMRAGEHELSVEFINDLYSPEKRLDRNAFLGDLDIIYFRKISIEKGGFDPSL